MPSGPNIASAYVQLIPTMEGAQSQITKELGGEGTGQSAGEKIGSGLKKALMAAGIGVALKKTFDGVVSVVKSSLEEGAALQQSTGGVETLFGRDGASTVEEYASRVGKSVSEVAGQYDVLSKAETLAKTNAQQAYATAGLSMNEYMELSTSLGAAMKAGSKDEVAAVTAIDKAIVALSDNANKMGTPMESLTTAFQGFAKGNYTMLDNLKLGYGGTKTEMERLLADAQAISGVEYDISNLSDVTDAISVIQDKLGITGTTASEASETFSGSFAAMKSAATNLLGVLTTGSSEDVSRTMQELSKAVETFVRGNLFPMLGTLIKNIPSLVTTAVKMIVDALPDMVGAAEELVSGLLTSFSSIDPEKISEVVSTILTSLGDFIATAAPQLATIAMTLLTGLINGIATAAPTLLPQVTEAILGTITALFDNAPQLVQAAIALLNGLIDGILAMVDTLLGPSGQATLNSIINAIAQALPMLLTAAVDLIVRLLDYLLDNVDLLIPAAIQLVVTVVEGIGSMLGELLSVAIELLIKFVAGLHDPDMISKILQSGIQIVKQLVGAIGSVVDSLWDAGMDIVRGIWQGISNGLGWIKNLISGWVGNVVDFIKNLFGIGSPSKVMAEQVGKWLPAGLADGIVDNASVIGDAWDDVAGGLTADASVNVLASASRIGAGMAQGSADRATRAMTPDQVAVAVARALRDVKVELDGREAGRFVERTVLNAVYY